MVLQALRPEEPLHQARPQPVLLQLGWLPPPPILRSFGLSPMQRSTDLGCKKGCRHVQSQPQRLNLWCQRMWSFQSGAKVIMLVPTDNTAGIVNENLPTTYCCKSRISQLLQMLKKTTAPTKNLHILTLQPLRYRPQMYFPQPCEKHCWSSCRQTCDNVHDAKPLLSILTIFLYLWISNLCYLCYLIYLDVFLNSWFGCFAERGIVGWFYVSLWK